MTFSETVFILLQQRLQMRAEPVVVLGIGQTAAARMRRMRQTISAIPSAESVLRGEQLRRLHNHLDHMRIAQRFRRLLRRRIHGKNIHGEPPSSCFSTLRSRCGPGPHALFAEKKTGEMEKSSLSASNSPSGTPEKNGLEQRTSYSKVSLFKNSARASFQSGIGVNPSSFRRRLTRREFFGRGAGRGNSSVEHGITFWEIPF